MQAHTHINTLNHSSLNAYLFHQIDMLCKCITCKCVSVRETLNLERDCCSISALPCYLVTVFRLSQECSFTPFSQFFFLSISSLIKCVQYNDHHEGLQRHTDLMFLYAVTHYASTELTKIKRSCVYLPQGGALYNDISPTFLLWLDNVILSLYNAHLCH